MMGKTELILIKKKLQDFKNATKLFVINIDEIKANFAKMEDNNDTYSLKKLLMDSNKRMKQLNIFIEELSTYQNCISSNEELNTECVDLIKKLKYVQQSFSNLLKEKCLLLDHFSFDSQKNDSLNEPDSSILQTNFQCQSNKHLLNYNENLKSHITTFNILAQDLESLKQAMNEITNLVEIQGDQVNSIEQAVDVSVENVKSGAKDISIATKLHLKSTSVLVASAIGLCIGGPIGVAVGAKIGCATTLGTGLLSYKAQKWIKSSRNKNSELDL